MISVLLAVALLQQAPTPREGPSILIFYAPGWVKNWEKHRTLGMAVWMDGRIQWRDPFPEWGRRNGEWGLNEGAYYEATISAKAVRAALEKLYSSRVLEVKNWNNFYVDGGATVLVVSYRDKRADLRSRVLTPPMDAPGGWPDGRWKSGVDAWNLSLKVARGLIPASGKKIAKPDFKTLFESPGHLSDEGLHPAATPSGSKRCYSFRQSDLLGSGFPHT